jgi:hypothetical protein
MEISELMGWGRRGAFNDIEFHEGLEAPPEGLLAREVPGLLVFAQHGSGSMVALYEEHVVWLDSEGEQFVIARNVDEFVDALHLHAGSLYDAMSACQGTSYTKPGNLASAAALEKRFNAEWIQDNAETAREEFEGYDAFEAWAAERGRGVPLDLADRLIALRPVAQRLRVSCGAG